MHHRSYSSSCSTCSSKPALSVRIQSPRISSDVTPELSPCLSSFEEIIDDFSDTTPIDSLPLSSKRFLNSNSPIFPVNLPPLSLSRHSSEESFPSSAKSTSSSFRNFTNLLRIGGKKQKFPLEISQPFDVNQNNSLFRVYSASVEFLQSPDISSFDNHTQYYNEHISSKSCKSSPIISQSGFSTQQELRSSTVKISSPPSSWLSQPPARKSSGNPITKSSSSQNIKLTSKSMIPQSS